MSFLINPYRFVQGGCSGNIISTSNLNVYYKLDGNALDSSGNANNGTETSMSYSSSIAKFQSSGVFNGTTSKIVGSSNVSSSTSGTVTGWFYTNSTSNKQILDGSASSVGPNIQIFSSKLYFGVKDGTGGWATTAGNITTGRWYHFAGTWNGVNIKLYINAYLTATTVNSNNAGAYTPKLGADSTDSAAGFFNGYIDDISFFSRELSQSEITTLYTSTCPLSGS